VSKTRFSLSTRSQEAILPDFALLADGPDDLQVFVGLVFGRW